MIDDLMSHAWETWAMKDLLKNTPRNKTNFEDKRLKVSP